MYLLHFTLNTEVASACSLFKTANSEVELLSASMF